MTTLLMARNANTKLLFGKGNPKLDNAPHGFCYAPGSMGVSYLTEAEASVLKATYENVQISRPLPGLPGEFSHSRKWFNRQNPQGKPFTEGFLGKFAGTTKE